MIGLVVTGHYPLNHHPGRLAIEHLEQYCFGWKEISQWFSYLQSILFVASTTAVAVVVRPFSPLASLCLRSLVCELEGCASTLSPTEHGLCSLQRLV